MSFCRNCGSKLVDDECPKCDKNEEKIEELEKDDLEVHKTDSSKKSSSNNKIGIFLLLIAVLCVGLYLGAHFLGGKDSDGKDNKDTISDSSWEVTYLYEDGSKVYRKAYFHGDHSFEFVTSYSDSSKKESYTGKWKMKKDDVIGVTLSSEDEEEDEYSFYLIEDDVICLGKKDCTNVNQLYRSSSNRNKEIRDEDLEYDDEDEDDYEEDKKNTNRSYDNAFADTNGNWSFQMTYDKNYDKNKVVINIFYGDGCSHCEKLFEFLDGLDDDIKEKFVVQKYEAWSNDDNAALMEDCSSYLDDDANGVPYILIGDHSWLGYSSEYDSEILEAINAGTGGDYYNFVEWYME